MCRECFYTETHRPGQEVVNIAPSTISVDAAKKTFLILSDILCTIDALGGGVYFEDSGGVVGYSIDAFVGGEDSTKLFLVAGRVRMVRMNGRTENVIFQF